MKNETNETFGGFVRPVDFLTEAAAPLSVGLESLITLTGVFPTWQIHAAATLTHTWSDLTHTTDSCTHTHTHTN